jgi:hypothetical protein
MDDLDGVPMVLLYSTGCSQTMDVNFASSTIRQAAASMGLWAIDWRSKGEVIYAWIVV